MTEDFDKVNHKKQKTTKLPTRRVGPLLFPFKVCYKLFVKSYHCRHLPHTRISTNAMGSCGGETGHALDCPVKGYGTGLTELRRLGHVPLQEVVTSFVTRLANQITPVTVTSL